MGFDVRIILLSYRRLYLVACLSPSVLCPFVGGGEPVCLSSISWAGGRIYQSEHSHKLSSVILVRDPSSGTYESNVHLDVFPGPRRDK